MKCKIIIILYKLLISFNKIKNKVKKNQEKNSLKISLENC